MEKDLQMSALEYKFKSNDHKGLIAELQFHLKDMDKYHDLRNFFYRVDLSQKWLGNSDFLVLSEKLWDRVLQKVWIRNTYQERMIK